MGVDTQKHINLLMFDIIQFDHDYTTRSPLGSAQTVQSFVLNLDWLCRIGPVTTELRRHCPLAQTTIYLLMLCSQTVSIPPHFLHIPIHRLLYHPSPTSEGYIRSTRIGSSLPTTMSISSIIRKRKEVLISESLPIPFVR